MFSMKALGGARVADATFTDSWDLSRTYLSELARSCPEMNSAKSTGRGVAAVGMHDLAGHVAGIVAGQEQE
jgi:hypothetical protein